MRIPSAIVVIPAFNASKTIDRTLESAVASLCHCIEERKFEAEIELVVVDDCSTDGTADLVAAWTARAPVRLIRNAVNRGPGFSRNGGVRQSEGSLRFFSTPMMCFIPTIFTSASPN